MTKGKEEIILTCEKSSRMGGAIYRMFWIFVICSLAGDGIEVIFVRVTEGEWMSRSSLLYGPFSIVWGLGGVLLTAALGGSAHKGGLYIFAKGALIGGVYEYACSAFTEYFYGVVFWDYSHIPLNIGGRVSLIFCIFWGALSLVWVRGIHPRLSALISHIPPAPGRVTAGVLAVLLAADMALTAAALGRMSERADGKAPSGAAEELLDRVYTDEYLAGRYKNLKETG